MFCSKYQIKTINLSLFIAPKKVQPRRPPPSRVPRHPLRGKEVEEAGPRTKAASARAASITPLLVTRPLRVTRAHTLRSGQIKVALLVYLQIRKRNSFMCECMHRINQKAHVLTLGLTPIVRRRRDVALLSALFLMLKIVLIKTKNKVHAALANAHERDLP